MAEELAVAVVLGDEDIGVARGGVSMVSFGSPAPKVAVPEKDPCDVAVAARGGRDADGLGPRSSPPAWVAQRSCAVGAVLGDED